MIGQTMNLIQRMLSIKWGENKPMDINSIILKASGAVLELFKKVGLSDDIFKKITVSASEGRESLLLTVIINATALEEIFFLRGGKICAILQGYAPELPGNIDGKKVEYIFSPLKEETKKTAGLSTGLLGQAINNIGDWALNNNVPELVTSAMIAQHIWKEMEQRDIQMQKGREGYPTGW